MDLLASIDSCSFAMRFAFVLAASSTKPRRAPAKRGVLGSYSATSMVRTLLCSRPSTQASATRCKSRTHTPPYLDFSFGLQPTGGAVVDGSFSDLSNEGAVVLGDGGGAIVNGFLNDTAGAQGEQLTRTRSWR